MMKYTETSRLNLEGRGVLDTRFRGYDDGGRGGQIAQ
jgi:hypothetical protein